MNIVCATAAVAAAIHPDAVTRLRGETARDLGLALTLVLAVPTMAELLTFRSLSLTPLTDDHLADYFFGTTTAGVQMRPIDTRGRHLATARTKEALMNVTAVNILHVGESAIAAESA